MLYKKQINRIQDKDNDSDALHACVHSGQNGYF